MTTSRRILVRSQEDLWTFTRRNVPLWDILDFFPSDCIGPRGPADAPRPYAVQPIRVDTDLGFSFETDIQYGSWIFRPKSPKQPGMMKWCRERGLRVGDVLVFERTGERTYLLRLERLDASEPDSPGTGAAPEAGGASGEPGSPKDEIGGASG